MNQRIHSLKFRFLVALNKTNLSDNSMILLIRKQNQRIKKTFVGMTVHDTPSLTLPFLCGQYDERSPQCFLGSQNLAHICYKKNRTTVKINSHHFLHYK